MKVTPIIAPAVDWEAFLSEVNAALGRSPAASLITAGMKPGMLKTVAPALGEFTHRGTPAIPFLKSRDSDQVLSHLWLSFLLEASPETVCKVGCFSRLSILTPDDSESVMILSGSLRQWRDAVISLGHRGHTADVRAVATEVYAYLFRAGLGDLFADCEVKKQPDGTTTIEIRSRK